MFGLKFVRLFAIVYKGANKDIAVGGFHFCFLLSLKLVAILWGTVRWLSYESIFYSLTKRYDLLRDKAYDVSHNLILHFCFETNLYNEYLWVTVIYILCTIG